jgi:nucleoside-diphosphate-sugar epimerase
MTVAVVGASGVLGRRLLPVLRDRGHAIRAISRNPATEVSGVEAIAIDLLSDAADRQLSAALSRCDAVVHIATAIPRNMAAPGAWEQNTRIRIDGTRRLLAACAVAGVRRYVQQSVVMAYPGGGDSWISEQTPLDDNPARADICRPAIEMETQVRALPATELSWVILRGGTFVGPGTMQDNLIAEVQAGKASIVGAGAHYMPLIHVADMARAVQLAIEWQGHSAIWNICAEPIRQVDYVTGLAQRLAAPAPTPRPDLAAPPSWRCTSAAAERELGWTAGHPIWPVR